jgi:uncharacterized protein
VRVFLDTNVLISAVATRGLAADVFRAVLTEHTLLTGEVVIGEVRRVMKRKLQVPAAVIDEFEGLLREHEVVPKPKAPASFGVRDRDDQWVLASAIEARADVLVTGDKDLLAARKSPVRIVTPRDFWSLLRGELD